MKGEKFGRWTVIGDATPRYRAHGQLRQRVKARCVCGVERELYEMDLTYNRSTGCESPRCKARWQAAEYAKASLHKVLVEDFDKKIATWLEERLEQWQRDERQKERDAEMAGEE